MNPAEKFEMEMSEVSVGGRVMGEGGGEAGNDDQRDEGGAHRLGWGRSGRCQRIRESAITVIYDWGCYAVQIAYETSPVWGLSFATEGVH